MLEAEGLLTGKVRYGSAYSGIDIFAVAMEVELGIGWEYVFASEAIATVHKGLLRAWGGHGLTEACCYADARSEEAVGAPAVDVFVLTASCGTHSRRNHSRAWTEQRASLEDMWAALGYVRAQKPRVVVVENVVEGSVTGGVTGLLGRLGEYRMRTGAFDPRTVAGVPVARERQFWVLTLR